MTSPPPPLIDQVSKLADEPMPCPFCGQRGIAHRVPTGWRVSCSECDAQPRPGYPSDTKAEAITAWNTRIASHTPVSGSIGELVEQLKLDVAHFRMRTHPQDQTELNRIDRIEQAADTLALQARADRLEEALTPSGATKAEYIGEFSFYIEEQSDEAMCPVSRRVPVPWTTIKEIMAAIRARALSPVDQVPGK